MEKERYEGIFINLNDSLDQFCFISRDIVDSNVDERTFKHVLVLLTGSIEFLWIFDSN